MKTPQELELEFTKRELALVRVNVQKLESENKDMKRKNDILTSMVKMFEERDLKETHSNVNRDSSPTQANDQVLPSKKCLHQSCSDKDILSDLLRFFIRIFENKFFNDVSQPSAPSPLLPSRTHPSSGPPPPPPTTSPVFSMNDNKCNQHVQQTSECTLSNPATLTNTTVTLGNSLPPSSSPTTTTLSDSIVTLDEFAMDVSEEAANHLNSKRMTTQTLLRLQ